MDNSISRRVKYPGADWKGAKGARDIISHHYFDLNAKAVFGICQRYSYKYYATFRCH
ncbi:MAG: HepT-like ribonuclease domain-containing protein [Deltaproteobacteria bacterium]